MNYQKIYMSIVNNARADEINRICRKKTGEYFEKHHIKPKSIGGDNSKANLVFLTPREHFICHALLIRFLSGVDLHKMKWAFFRLCSCSGKNNPKAYGYVNARIYEHFKQGFQQGENNSQYGTKWWVNQTTGDTTKSINSPGDNWVLGRSLESFHKKCEYNRQRMKHINVVTGKRIPHNILSGDKLDERVQMILSSGVDLTQMGWIAQVTKVTGLTRREVYKAYGKSVELQEKCYRRLPPNEVIKRRQEVIKKYIDAGVQPDKCGRFTSNLVSETEWARRKDIIISCGVDLTIYGWAPRVSKLTGMPKYEIYQVLNHYPEFKKTVYLRSRTNASLA